jgi:ABC-type transport system substrate-binding protein
MKSLILKIFLISFLLKSSILHAIPDGALMASWKKNGLLIFSVPVKLDDPVPTLFLNMHTKLSLPLVYEPLVSIGSQQELKPVLASSWHVSDDNKSLIINIKPKHFFSDNTEVTANDIANSISRVCSKNSKVFEEIKGLNGCEGHAQGKNVKLGMHVINKYVIKFDINCSPTNFLYQLSSPNTVVTKLTNKGLLGSGSYTIKNKSSDYLVLVKNTYASKDSQAKNTGIVLFYTNWDKLPSVLLNEKPDGAVMYKMEDLLGLGNKNYSLIKVNPNITEILVLNNQRFPFNNTLFRQAFAAELYNHFDHTCVPGAHKAYGVIPFGTGGSIDGNPPERLPGISPKNLFNHIPELKNKNAIVTIYQLADSRNNCESSQLIKAARKYHVDLRFNYENNYRQLKSLYINHQLGGFVELYVFRNREAYSTLQYFTKLGPNHANVSSTIIDSMLQNAISVSSSHDRFKLYQKIANYMQKEGVVITLFYMYNCFVEVSDNFLYSPFLYLPNLQKIKNCDP